MTRMNRWIGGFAGLLLAMAMTGVSAAPQAGAGDRTLAAVEARIGKVQLLRGRFEQEKQVQGFRNPLRSQGRFVLARDRGVLWTTEKPFPSEVVLTGQRILSRQPDGSMRIELDGRQQPALAAANAMMLALVGGDVGALSTHFRIRAEALAGDRWRMTLVPRGAALARAFTSIALSGDRHVREVEIIEAGGDRTRLRFSELAETPARLSPAEAARFD